MPKDIDFVVFVDDQADLAPLARLARKLIGRTGSECSGADIFLADPLGNYIGRTCSWKECRPGIRVSCEALHCGERQYLYDDLLRLKLSKEKIAAAIELWPVVEERAGLPEDLKRVMEQLRSSAR